MKANHISLNYQWKLKLRIKHHDIYIKSIQRNIQNQIQRSNSSTLFSNLWSIDKRCSVFIEWRLNTLGCFWISLYILVFLCKRLERFCRYQHVDSRVFKDQLSKGANRIAKLHKRVFSEYATQFHILFYVCKH